MQKLSAYAYTCDPVTRAMTQITPGSLLSIQRGEVVMTELGQFSPHTLVCAGDDERVILAMTAFTLIELVQEGLGTIQYGYVLDPSQQISLNDDDTVTLKLYPLTHECTWEMTHRNWIAQNYLSVICTRLGALVPGWTGLFTDAWGGPADVQCTVTLNNPTVLAGWIETAKQFSQFARQGWEGGIPVRRLEMGQFGAAPTTHLVSVNGADPNKMRDSTINRLVATVDRTPNTATAFVNVTVPFGGGANGTLVTLERLWRIINDPGYPDFGRWGTDAASIARTGKASLFPEYDDAYPISDPRQEPTGTATWYTTHPGGTLMPLPTGSHVYAVPNATTGVPDLYEYDGAGLPVVGAVPVLAQGATGTRFPTLNGEWDYMVYDRASYATYGHKMGEMTDSSLTYADNSPANQEMTERALYQETVGNFKRFAHTHHTFSCTAVGIGRPTQAGDLITVDYQRVSIDRPSGRAVQEVAVTDDLIVMAVVRVFDNGADNADPTDQYTLSDRGRFDMTDASGAASTAQQMISLQRRMDTSLAPLTVYATDNVDAETPMKIHVSVPKQLFRWQKCNFRVDFLPYQGASTTAVNSAVDIPISVGGQDVLLDLPDDLNLASTANAGAYSDATGYETTKDTIGGMPIHYHTTAIGGSIGQQITPDSTSTWVRAISFGNSIVGLIANHFDGGDVRTTKQILDVDLAPTAATHKVPIAKTLRKRGATIARIAAFKAIALLTPHTHPLDQRIPTGTPTAPSCTMIINGIRMTSALLLTNGTRNADGTFPADFEIDDLSAFLNANRGDYDIELWSTTSGSNPYGAGRFRVSATWFGEFGGLSSTVLAA